MGRGLALLAATLLCSAAPSLAADAGTFAGATVPDWTGPYAGIAAGMTTARSVEDIDPAAGATYDPYVDLGAASITFGAFGGFNWQANDRLVLGAEAAAALRGLSGEYLANQYGDEFRSTWTAALRGRAGLLLRPEVLLYGSLGWQWADFDYSEGAFGPRQGFDPVAFTAGGPQLGAGIEAMLANRFLVRADVTYARYGEQPIQRFGSPAWVVQPDEFAATLGLGYHFGGTRPAAAAAPAPVDWNGLHAGVEAGFVAAKTYEDRHPDFGPTGSPFWTYMAEGGSLGAFLGYDRRIGEHLVAGLGASGHLRDVRSDFEDYDFYSRSTWSAAIRARAGVLLGPATLLYGSAGWQWADFDLTDMNDPALGYSGGAYVDSGPQAGAGIETRIGRVLLRTDLTYTWFGDHVIDWNGGHWWTIAGPNELSAQFGIGLKL